MNKKIFCEVVFVITLLITTTVLPVVGTMDEKMCQFNDTILPPSAEWRKIFGGDEFDHFHSARQTSDGGYIACGLTEESNEYFAWLVKVDSNGIEEWSKINYDINGTYLTNTDMWVSAFDVIETSDKGFLICGVSMIPGEYEDESFWTPTGYLWKTDYKGDTEWIKHYWIENLEELLLGLYWLYSVIEVDNGFVCGGMIVYTNPADEVVDYNGSIFKFDLSGNILWYQEFDKTKGVNQLSSIYYTSDGGFILGGFVEGNIYQGNDALWMVKTEEDGTLDWEQIFDGPGFEYTAGKGFHETSDGGYIMNGVSNSFSDNGKTDVWVIKTDKNGNEKWSKTYGYENNDYCWGMCKADNDGFALGICLNWGALTEDADICIIETDENGNIEWISEFENEGHQETRSINPTNDGGYIVGGMTSTQFGDPECDAILYKFYSYDNERPLKPTITGGHKGKPDKEYTFTASSSDPDDHQLFYLWDWGDGNFSEWISDNKATYSWANEDNFEIRVLVKDWYGYESEWSDLFEFSTPKNKSIEIPLLLQKLFQCFPFFEKILNQFL